jgi:peptide/nickel transport system permease protein
MTAQVSMNRSKTGTVGQTRMRIWWRRIIAHRGGWLSLSFLVSLYLFSLIGPRFLPYSPEQIDLNSRLVLFSSAHPLGTDEIGRDNLVRLVYGARISLTVGVAATLISVGVGTLLGSVSGYFGGYLDAITMRLTDAFLSIPLFFLLLTVLTLLGSGTGNIIAVIGLTSWMRVARLVRGETIRFKVMEFVEAARVVGAKDSRIIFRHILLQCVPTIGVAASFNAAFAILAESALSYLGLGVQPPMPSWGNMLAASQNFLWNAPQLAVYPGLAIFVTVLSFNALGEGLRGAFDPYEAQKSR